MIGFICMKQLKELKNDNITKEFILERAGKLTEEAQIKKAPVDLGLLASLCDIRKIIKKNIPEAGILFPLEGGGAEIYLRDTDGENRQRFTCCHEIVHTFFPDYQLKPRKRIDKEVGGYAKDKWVEYLCDFGASELLMPHSLFRSHFLKYGFSVDSLCALSSIFQASLEAVAIKMVNQNPENSALIIWEKKYKPVENPIKNLYTLPGLEKYKPEEKIRINFGIGFEKLGYIPTHKSLKESEKIIEKSFIENKKLYGTEDIDFGSFKVNGCGVYTMPLGYPDERRVLSLLAF